MTLGDEIVGRINRLAAISETPDNLTRIFLTGGTSRGGGFDHGLDG